MKVYIITHDYTYEGHTVPLAAFDTLEKAEQWCKDHPDEGLSCFNCITELEVE